MNPRLLSYDATSRTTIDETVASVDIKFTDCPQDSESNHLNCFSAKNLLHLFSLATMKAFLSSVEQRNNMTLLFYLLLGWSDLAFSLTLLHGNQEPIRWTLLSWLIPLQWAFLNDSLLLHLGWLKSREKKFDFRIGNKKKIRTKSNLKLKRFFGRSFCSAQSLLFWETNMLRFRELKGEGKSISGTKINFLMF